MKASIILILTVFILLLTPIISVASNIQEIYLITSLSFETYSIALNNDGPPTIPNIIWGNVYVNGVKISSEDNCTLILKINDATFSTYVIGKEKKYGDLYRFIIPAYSQNIDIFVLYNGTLLKAYSIPSVKTAEIIRHDISIVTNREPEPPKLLAQLTSEMIEIPMGGIVYEKTISFKGYINDPDGDKVKLQVEIEKIKDFGIHSSGINLYESAFYESSQNALLSVYGLTFASYKWRARTVDQYGNCSDWVCFGDNDNEDIDFSVEPCLKLSSFSYNFGSVEIGTYKDWKFSISNLSSKSVIINQIRSSNSAFIATSPSFPYQLPANSILNVKIRFAPVESITYSGIISIITDEFLGVDLEDIRLNISLSGTGRDGKPDLTPMGITFPKLPIVMEKTIVTLTIKNIGTKRSPNSQLKLKIFVYDENEKPLQGSILDIGNIESIDPGKYIDVSFTYIFVSSELSSYLDIEILPKNSMDSDFANNVIRIKNFRPESNPQPSLNFVGELLEIAGSSLLDGTETKELIENIISYAYEQFILNYDKLINENDIEKVMTFYYRTVVNTYRNITNLKGRSLMLRCISYVKLLVNNINNQKYPLAYRVVLKNLFESFWRMIIQKNGQWEPWELFLFFLNPSSLTIESPNEDGSPPVAGLIVEDRDGRVTSIIGGEITEGIQNSFGFNFEGQIAVAIIGNSAYKVKVRGLSDGHFTLALYMPNIDGENLILKKYENIPISTNSQAELNILSSDNTLIIDTDNDGTADGSFIPDYTDNIALEDIMVTIQLNTGWNLFSIPVLLDNNLISSVLQSIAGKFQSIWTYENRWKRHFANVQGHVNDLYAIEVGKGYWINMIEPAELVIKGKQIINSALQLNEGWNLVGYTSLMPRTIDKALAGISNRYQSVWSYDGSWRRNIAGAYANTLSEMEPGKGYWINVTSSCEWDIRSSAKPAPSIRISALQTDMPEIPCILFGKVFINNMLADSSVNVILKTNGNIYTCSKLENGCYLLEFPQTISADIYVQHGDAFVYAKSIKNPLTGELTTADLSVSISSNSLYQNFPNPFNPDTWIPYSLGNRGRVTIQIRNMSGQLIRTFDLGYKNPGSYTSKEESAYWDGTNEYGEKVSSGIYFYTILTDDFKQTRKMVLLR